MPTVLEHALAYHDAGFQVLPLKPKSKKPALLEWKPLQIKRLERSSVESYFTKNPDCNIGIITGHLSNLTVLDFDIKKQTAEATALMREFVAKMNPPLIVDTGSGGLHVYCKGSALRNEVTIPHLPFDLDIRSQGGYVVAPPSWHDKNATQYTWRGAAPDTLFDFQMLAGDLPNVPEEIMEKASLNLTHPATKLHDWKQLVSNVVTGERHPSATVLFGKLIRVLPMEEWAVIAVPLTRLWNAHNVHPSLPDKDMEKIFFDIATREVARRKGPRNV